jgi:hypothetical protein
MRRNSEISRQRAWQPTRTYNNDTSCPCKIAPTKNKPGRMLLFMSCNIICSSHHYQTWQLISWLRNLTPWRHERWMGIISSPLIQRREKIMDVVYPGAVLPDLWELVLSFIKNKTNKKFIFGYNFLEQVKYFKTYPYNIPVWVERAWNNICMECVSRKFTKTLSQEIFRLKKFLILWFRSFHLLKEDRIYTMQMSSKEQRKNLWATFY